MGERSRSIGRWLVIASFGLMLLSWAMSTPPGGFPDEVDHYVRAVAVGRGAFYGTPSPQLTDPVLMRKVPHSCCEPNNPASRRWVIQGVREVRIPAALAEEHLSCIVARHRSSGPCTPGFRTTGTVIDHTNVGTLEPLPYVFAGLATRATSDPEQALRLARLTNATLSLLLIAIAVTALWPEGWDNPLVAGGPLLAISPMVLFVGASPSPSAIEVLAGLAFFAVLLRLVRRAPSTSTRLWVAAGVVGVLLATSRSLGPIWVVLDALVVLAWVGPRRALAIVRTGGRAAAAAVVAVALGGLSTVVWEATHQPTVPFDLDFFADQLGPSTHQLDRVGQELIGRFGLVDIPLPIGATTAWVVAAVVLVVLVLVHAPWRGRAVLVGLFAGLVGVTITVTAGVMRQNGFDIQGRHVLALAVTVPLLAGELVRRRVGPLRRWMASGVVVLLAVVAGAVQLAGFVRAGRAYGWLSPHLARNAWLPPGGRAPWLVLAVVSSVLLPIGVGLSVLRRPRPLTAPAATASAATPAPAPVRRVLTSTG